MPDSIAVSPQFPLGETVITANAKATLPELDVMLALQRHHSGDWGDVCKEDRQENENALLVAERLFSVYHTTAGTQFWIITERDRSVTTVLLPEDY